MEITQTATKGQNNLRGYKRLGLTEHKECKVKQVSECEFQCWLQV